MPNFRPSDLADLEGRGGGGGWLGGVCGSLDQDKWTDLDTTHTTTTTPEPRLSLPGDGELADSDLEALRRELGDFDPNRCDIDPYSQPLNFCWSLSPSHVASEGHKEMLVEFLSKTWRFRGARRFIDRYGVEMVHHEIWGLAAEMQDPGAEPVRNPAAVLTWRVKALFDDTSGYAGKRLLQEEAQEDIDGRER